MKAKWPASAAALVFFALAASALAQQPPGAANPSIDMAGFLHVAAAAAAHRESRRVSEEEFLRLARTPGTVIVDARSREKYDELHIAGAISLSFPDIAVESLRRMIPSRSTRILIYCNNNFRGNESAFASKLPAASLNLSTYIALYTYGYRNVYELAPQVDVGSSILPFKGR
ncbi:MAG: rhodanese-like domain-containing protein [Casimicrobiaceae bacterium]